MNEYGLPRSEFGGVSDVYVGGGRVKCTQDEWDRIFKKGKAEDGCCNKEETEVR
jgi:hypothetical protein